MSKQRMKKRQVKAPAEVEEEKILGDNDTEEIQDFIKQLGLDSINPNTLEIPENQREKRTKLKKVSNQNSPEGPGPNSENNSNRKPVKAKYQEFKQNKFENRKSAVGEVSDSTSTFKQPAQNKKIIFDNLQLGKTSSNNEVLIIPPIGVSHNQNKKIVFDEDYISKSSGGKLEEKIPESDDAWYHLLIKPDVPWYQQDKPLKAVREVATEEVNKCEEEGKRYLEEDASNYQKVRAVGSDRSETKWIQTVLKSGAFADKIAAHTLLLQESPVHNLPSLKFLISLLDVKGRRECMVSLDALIRLFTEGRVLNPNAKLFLMNKKPISALSTVTPRERKELLALWSFEHQLKDCYNQFFIALDGLLKDAVDTTRRKGIAAIATLLAYSPEQEQGLLSRLVNKVGDPTRAVATSTVGQMERLLQQHPQMKLVVVAEVERLLYRSNINTKAQYYALCFLSQILLDSDDVLLATKLIIIYVTFFKACVKKGEVDSKLMAALLTGLKRAYPYSKTVAISGGPLDGHVDTLFKLVHMVRFSLATQVLCILDQIVDIDKSNSDRFYSVLFRKLFDPDVGLSAKQSMFLNLLYRALKRDESLPRLRTFVKRILQVCLACPPQLACALLYLVSELIKSRPQLQNFPKDIITKEYVEEDDDDEEHYKDVDNDDEEEDAAKEDATREGNDEQTVTSTWVHRKGSHSKLKSKLAYDPFARNPMYARAEMSGGMWEINLLTNHFHPSVALFAKTIVEGTPIEYTGDPLQDFTLPRFLDRFVFRNPKLVSAAQAKLPAQRRVLGKRTIYVPRGVRAMAVDSKEFAKQPKSSIPADEMFLYQYFKQRISKGSRVEKDSDDDDSDHESVASEEFEQYLAENTDFASDMKPKSKIDKKKKKGDKDGEDEDDEEVDGEGEDDLQDAEVDSEEDFDNDKEFQDAFKDFDDMIDGSNASDVEDEDEDFGEDDLEEGGFREEDVAFSDEDDDDDGDDDDDDEPSAPPPSKSKSKKRAVDEDIDDLDFAFGAQPSSSKKKRSRDLFNANGNDFVAAEDFAAILEANAGTGLNTAGTTEALANKDKASVKQLQWEMSRDRWMRDLNRPKKGGKKMGNKNKKGKSGPAFRKNRGKFDKQR
ncbi:CCAAT/enhancer-binding protein zeta [Daphnia magna]|uniref:CCAAT/enhancer-binding protein zeta n=1 Tax=Daphnia magna TaxID=35525 RepID=A0A162RQV6_9CRUS|nr:CCAAT/enhancer-binding protein zeta [Daphnia magna]